MGKAPYDKRNEADYHELTKKIRAGLEVLSKDPSIPATERSLAELSGCSRGTLRKRVWPLEGLRVVKRERRVTGKGERQNLPPAQPTAEEIHLADKKKLLEQLDKSRAENGRLFLELQEEKSKSKRLERVVKVLKAANAALEQRVSELEHEATELKGASTQAKGVVVPFGGSARGTPTKSKSKKRMK